MKANINNTDTLDFNPNSDNALVGDDFKIEIIDKNTKELKVSFENKKYIARLLKINTEEKKVVLKIDGHRFEIKLTDKYDDLLKSMGMGVGSTQKINEIKSPMPGVVFEIIVKVGETIKKDDPLLILEAMKMENILKSPIDATIKSILIEKGDTVKKNKVLIEFE